MKPAVIPALALGPLAQPSWTSTSHDPAARCADLARSLTLPNATVWFSEFVPANTTLTFPDNHPACARPSQFISVEICRVAARVSTSTVTDSSVSHGSVSFEAWLPLDWNGRFLAVGNGGLNGCILYEEVAYGISGGFATVGSNNGHNGTSGLSFYGNPATIEDYVYRALHTTTILGKLVVAAFYHEVHSHAYYVGCSGGGRQGLREAQQFPGDFDGIIAGAPAVAFGNLTSWRGSFYVRSGEPGDARFLTTDEWGLVSEDVFSQCDGLDGYVDGVLEDPTQCQYSPDALLCGDGNSTQACLTEAQLATVRDVFSDFRTTDGSLIYPRLHLGANPTSLNNGRPFQYSVDWFRYVIHQDPSWDPRTINQQDYIASATLDPYGVQGWVGDLSASKDRGVKIIHYHGLSDPVISSENSHRYYNHVAATMDLSYEEMDGFYRYFRVAGMNHCAGGLGAIHIGARPDTFAGWAPEKNVLSAVVRWVEDGVAPDYVEGTGYDDAGTFSRRHCRYPRRNQYTGEGDPRRPDGWECV